jgi:hypothetical protein
MLRDDAHTALIRCVSLSYLPVAIPDLRPAAGTRSVCPRACACLSYRDTHPIRPTPTCFPPQSSLLPDAPGNARSWSHDNLIYGSRTRNPLALCLFPGSTVQRYLCRANLPTTSQSSVRFRIPFLLRCLHIPPFVQIRVSAGWGKGPRETLEKADIPELWRRGWGR